MTRIRPPRRDELEVLRSIEHDAARAFDAIGMPEIAADEPLPMEDLEAFRAAGRAWVAVDGQNHPLAYLLSDVIDACAHIEQVSVRATSARRRLGSELIEHLATISHAEGRPGVTLTTFREVPWNAPYYRRLGFVVVEPADQGPQLRALVAHEAASIPSEAPRVAMRRSSSAILAFAGAARRS